MKKITKLILALLLAFSLQNCQDDEFDNSIDTDNTPQLNLNDDIFQSENFGNPTVGNFIGLITNKDGVKLENVQITIGNAITMTDRNGMFILNNAAVFENFAYVKTKKEGYIDGSRVVIPKTEGANTISIVMLKKEVTATINSGQNSQVSISNGALVNFSGDFVNTDGSTYTGAVEVVAHYVRPNSISTSQQMPGSLLAQDESNNAQNLETYGMLSINLFSPSGETLNINPESPATLEFPVDFTQTSIAPDTIDLWYFDETVGYWKEEGQAVKDGNKYIAEVTHFTWWNCDIPFDAVTLCFDITATNVDGNTPYLAIITRSSNNQLIFSGNVTSTEVECGLIPINEEVLVSIYSIAGTCNNQLVHSQTLGGYATDTSVAISFTEESFLTELTGVATNCAGNPITNGYVYINDSNIFSITDGSFSLGIIHCLENLTVNVQVFDFDTDQWAIAENITLNGVDTNIGTISTCGDSGGIYNGDVTLSSQSEVNDFGALNFNVINGDILIGDYFTSSDISNLAPLNSLESVSGNLTVVNSPNLTSLNGLSNITSVSQLRISDNASLTSIASLSNLSTIGSLLSIGYNSALTNLDGLENLTNPGNVRISQNNALTSISGLQSLTEVYRLNISSNAQLSSIAPLSNITTAFTVEIYNLPMLTSLQGLNQITEVELLRISYNNSLTDLSELSNLTVAESLSIGGNESLTSLNGLENLIRSNWLLVGRDIDFDVVNNAPNNSLTNFCALQNLFTNGTYSPTNSTFMGVYIQNNPFNPSVQNIIDGNCSQ